MSEQEQGPDFRSALIGLIELCAQDEPPKLCDIAGIAARAGVVDDLMDWVREELAEELELLEEVAGDE